jgi:hypothetical protein
VTKFSLPDASIMARQISPRGRRSGEIWHFREVGGGGVAENCKPVNGEKDATR